MFIFYDNTQLDTAFGVPGLVTRGTRSGQIFKLPWCYFKVYPSQRREQIYHCEGYYYGADVPFTVDDVPFTEIDKYAAPYKLLK